MIYVSGCFTALVLALLLPGIAPAQGPDPCDAAPPDAETGTAEWRLRDTINMFCSEQRKVDHAQHPVAAQPAVPGPLGPWADAYRQPARHSGIRFRYQTVSIGGISMEVYRPCSLDETVCPDLPDGLERFDPPYPVVASFHGFASRRDLHWWSSQTLAEAGYMVVSYTAPASTPGGYPSSPSSAQANAILAWLHAGGHPLAAEADVHRVGFAGHSAGAGVSGGFQGDPRVHALILWDGATSVSADPEHVTPAMFQRADYNTWPGYPVPNTEPPDNPVRASGFAVLRDKGVDTMVVTGRATTHIDWTGGLIWGNRYAELMWVYYNIAWFDRHLKGTLAFEENGDLVTYDGRTEAEEREYRQAIAQDAYDRLIADVFDDSADRHNVSQGFWDPVQAASSGDATYGGNVPYTVAGRPIADRLSFYYLSNCYVSVPDYGQGNGAPGDPVVARADTTPEGDMRTDGCPQVFP